MPATLARVRPSAERVFRRFAPFFAVSDSLMLLYWFIVTLDALGCLQVPEEHLYSNYHQPWMVVWNWSFLPLDLLMSLTGLLALRLCRQHVGAWYEVSLVSATLTFAAGFMAISYWTVAREFAWSWWIPNLALATWPIIYLACVIHAGWPRLSP
jgi:hypothetical protein